MKPAMGIRKPDATGTVLTKNTIIQRIVEVQRKTLCRRGRYSRNPAQSQLSGMFEGSQSRQIAARQFGQTGVLIAFAEMLRKRRPRINRHTGKDGRY